jgi:chromosome segregation ATPase
MAEVTQDHEQEHDEAHEGDGDGEDRRVPYSRFEEVNKRAKQAQDELDELRTRLTEFEDRDKSETERERAARERAGKQVQELSQTVTGLQKGSWVRSAAAELNFHDPEDAVTYLTDRLASLDDERDAKREVRALAKRKAHLVREERKDNRPNLQRVFGAQQPNGQNGAQNAPVTPAQAVAMQEAEFAQGLAGELSKFQDKWTSPGRGLFGSE